YFYTLSLHELFRSRQLLAFPRRGLGRIDFRILIFERGPVRHDFVVLRERKRERCEMIRRTQFFNCFCRGIQPEEMRVGLLLSSKINSVGPPVNESRIFIER